MKNGKAAIDWEGRLARLEADVKEIKAMLQAQQEPKQGWKAIVGSQANDPIAAEVNRQIAETREKERRKARRARCKEESPQLEEVILGRPFGYRPPVDFAATGTAGGRHP